MTHMWPMPPPTVTLMGSLLPPQRPLWGPYSLHSDPYGVRAPPPQRPLCGPCPPPQRPLWGPYPPHGDLYGVRAPPTVTLMWPVPPSPSPLGTPTHPPAASSSAAPERSAAPRWPHAGHRAPPAAAEKQKEGQGAAEDEKEYEEGSRGGGQGGGLTSLSWLSASKRSCRLRHSLCHRSACRAAAACCPLSSSTCRGWGSS